MFDTYGIVYALGYFIEWVQDSDYDFVMPIINSCLSQYSHFSPLC